MAKLSRDFVRIFGLSGALAIGAAELAALAILAVDSWRLLAPVSPW